MDLRKGLFRLTLVVSLLVGIFISLVSFLSEINSNKSVLAELRTESAKKWNWQRSGQPYKTFHEGKIKEVEDIILPDIEQKEYGAIRDDILKQLTYWETIKNKPEIFLAVSKMFLLGFVPVWIIYFIIRYILIGFTAKDKGKEMDCTP